MNKELDEALECLNHIKKYYIPKPCSAKTYDCLETIKQALLKAQENARSEEILQKYYQEGITLDSVRALKKENELLKGQAQEPKHYLKWEDLEFNIDKQMMTVLLNGTKYTLIVGRNVHIDKLAFLRNGEINYYFLEDDKQFFNDLHLERVEE